MRRAGVVAVVLGERAVAVRAEAAAVALPAVRVDAQAGVLVGVKRAEIQSAPPGRSGAIAPKQILDVAGFVVASDGDAGAIRAPSWLGA